MNTVDITYNIMYSTYENFSLTQISKFATIGTKFSCEVFF